MRWPCEQASRLVRHLASAGPPLPLGAAGQGPGRGAGFAPAGFAAKASRRPGRSSRTPRSRRTREGARLPAWVAWLLGWTRTSFFHWKRAWPALFCRPRRDDGGKIDFSQKKNNKKKHEASQEKDLFCQRERFKSKTV